MTEPWRRFVEKLFVGHRQRLVAYLRRRIRSESDAPDLAQEVYLRMLRVRDPDAIRNAEVYLFTVAKNLLMEHAVLDRRRAASVDIDGEGIEIPQGDLPDSGDLVDGERRSSQLREALAQLSPKCRATVLMQYQYGMTYREIGARLGISTHMVKKYHSQAICHCRQWLDTPG